VVAASIHFISLLRIFPVCIFPVSGNDCSDFALFVNAMLYAFCCAVAVAGFVFLLPKGKIIPPLADTDLQKRINQRYGLFITAVCLFSGASGGITMADDFGGGLTSMDTGSFGGDDFGAPEPSTTPEPSPAPDLGGEPAPAESPESTTL